MATKYEEEDLSEGASEDASESATNAVAALLTSEAELSSSAKKRKRDPDSDTPQSASKRKESEVWRFYEKHSDRTKNCRVCQKKFSVNTATGALRKHLVSHFGEQTDAILARAQTAMEVIISPSTNTVTVSDSEPGAGGDTVITTTPVTRGRRALLAKSAPVATPVVADIQHSKQRYKSDVWQHFVRHEDGRPECIHCQYQYSSNASTSGLRRHAEIHEKEKSGELSLKNPKMAAHKTSAMKLTPTNSVVQAGRFVGRTPNGNVAPLLGEDSFLRLVIRAHLSGSEIAEDFGALYQLGTGKAASATAMDTKMKALFGKKKEEVKQFLKQFASKISLSTEMWQSCDGHDYLIVTAHVMTDTWTPLRFVLDCLLVSPDVQSEAIKEQLVAILKDFQSSDKVLAIATESDRVNNAIVNQAARLYKTYITHNGGQEIAQVICIGSGLATCVEPVLESISHQVNKVRRFIKVLLNSHKFSELQNQVALNLQDYHELKVDTPAIWSSTVTMLDAAVKMKGVIDDLINRNTGLFDAFTPDDWTILELILELVSNFHLAVQDLVKTDYPTLSIALPLVEYLTTNLTTQRDRADVPAWFKKIAKDMLERTNKLLLSMLTDVYFFGTILDPRHKLTTIPSNVGRQSVEENLRVAFARYLQPGSVVVAESLNNGVVSAYKAGSLMSAILKKNQASTVQPQLDELNQYLNTAVEVPDADPLKWWENYRKVYPNLALMARDYVSVPATSVPSDQLFVKEKMAAKWRNRLDAEDLPMYVCLKSWIDLDFGVGPPTTSSTISLKK